MWLCLKFSQVCQKGQNYISVSFLLIQIRAAMRKAMECEKRGWKLGDSVFFCFMCCASIFSLKSLTGVLNFPFMICSWWNAFSFNRAASKMLEFELKYSGLQENTYYEILNVLLEVVVDQTLIKQWPVRVFEIKLSHLKNNCHLTRVL